MCIEESTIILELSRRKTNYQNLQWISIPVDTIINLWANSIVMMYVRVFKTSGGVFLIRCVKVFLYVK